MSGICNWCSVEAARKYSAGHLCSKHYRMLHMRSSARKRYKTAPSYEELELLTDNLGPALLCPSCGRGMNWLKGDGASSVITLQHNHDGTIQFLCHSCNVRHMRYENDSFYNLPEDHKKCPRCERILNLNEFHNSGTNSKSYKKRAGYCKRCMSELHQERKTKGGNHE